ncbi:hypothetical protein LGR54_17810 [Ancylobacter sp. Lp-2]|uniref:hypothetical protein n=1 Tax=Ancylobacter sp. Lp-2 TaxID=2881339 RepID=UPI001E3A893A|nr:hypothetical protein [Ancylobacter sp. Lp-2]MCB4770468.1 hypothetical protein [Ancylobacter sp. Lp-2]
MKALGWFLLCNVMTISAAAAQTPDMKGDWVGKTNTIIAGVGGPHWPDSKGTWEKPLLAQRDITLRIIGQEDRRFWGESIIAGDASSGGTVTTEPFIGTVSKGGDKVMMADTDGYFVGDLSGTTLSYCYLQAGARQANDKPAVATCNDVTKR